MFLLQLDFFLSLGIFCLSDVHPLPGSPPLPLPPLNPAAWRCKAKGYKPLSLQKRVAVVSKFHKRNMLHFLKKKKFEVKYDFVYLQNVSFVIIALFCTWESDRRSVLAVRFFVYEWRWEGSVPANYCLPLYPGGLVVLAVLHACEKFTSEHTMKAQRGSRGITTLSLTSSAGGGG